MFMTADYLLYKPNIIFLTVCSGVAYLLMTGTPSVARLRVSTIDYFLDSTYILDHINFVLMMLYDNFIYFFYVILSVAVLVWYRGNI